MFLTTSVKEDLFLGVLCEWDLNFFTLLIFNILLWLIYLNYIKLKLKFMFVLNWDIIYFLILKF
jgi:hypothetical protein